MAKQRGLGKGLSSLIPTAERPEPVAEVPIIEEAPQMVDITTLPLGELETSPFQPRKTLNGEQLAGLAASIKEHGIIQPILVRRVGDKNQIVAGERRWRAAQLAEIERIPVRYLDLSDAQAMELALVENLQREDLTTIEIAQGIQELVSRLALTHEEVAQKIGISRTAVTNKLRLLQLPERAIEMLENEEITEGHARALLSLPSADKILEYANLVVQRNLNVRQLEELVRNATAAAKIAAALPRKAAPVSDFADEIDRLQRNFKLTVRIGGGRKSMGLFIKGLKKWQVQMLLEFIENSGEELFPRE